MFAAHRVTAGGPPDGKAEHPRTALLAPGMRRAVSRRRQDELKRTRNSPVPSREAPRSFCYSITRNSGLHRDRARCSALPRPKTSCPARATDIHDAQVCDLKASASTCMASSSTPYWRPPSRSCANCADSAASASASSSAQNATTPGEMVCVSGCLNLRISGGERAFPGLWLPTCYD